MLKQRSFVLIAVVAAVGFVGAGCGDDTASTDTGSSTPPAATAPSTTTAPAAGGDTAAGKTVYEGKCQGCHGEGGLNGPSGPPLAQVGLTADAVKQQVTNPRNAMPPNLASGQDLEDVAAYVVSLQ